MYVYVYIYIYVNRVFYVRMYVCMYVCMHVCIYMYYGQVHAITSVHVMNVSTRVCSNSSLSCSNHTHNITRCTCVVTCFRLYISTHTCSCPPHKYSNNTCAYGFSHFLAAAHTRAAAQEACVYSCKCGFWRVQNLNDAAS
jgi:hypothetical protein